MKKFLLVLFFALLFSGCSTYTFEHTAPDGSSQSFRASTVMYGRTFKNARYKRDAVGAELQIESASGDSRAEQLFDLINAINGMP